MASSRRIDIGVIVGLLNENLSDVDVNELSNVVTDYFSESKDADYDSDLSGKLF